MQRHTLLTLDFPPLQDGGIARWMDELARGLAEAEIPTAVLTRGRKPAALAHDAAYPVPVTRLYGHGWVQRHRLYLRAYGPFLGRTLAGGVLHGATYSMLAPLLSRARGLGATTLCYVHGLELVRAAGVERELLAQTLGGADLVVANSARVARLAAERGARPEALLVLAPAIDPARIAPVGPDLRARWEVGDRPLILSLGRLVARKGQDTVLRALPELLRKLPNLIYVIAGKGSDQARLEALAGELGVTPNVRFVGFVPEGDLAAAYRSADVYAMIAREGDDDLEGFGMTYLEANSAARPVVGGRSGGTEDAIVDGTTGLLVDPIDPRETTAALLALLGDPERRRAIGAAGRRRVESEMSRRSMVKALLSRLEQRAVAPRRPSGSPPRA